jgi:UDP-glucose 4-epimerase
VRVLVTGASGLIGRSVVAELMSRGHLVKTLQRGPAVSSSDPDQHVQAEITSAVARAAAAAAEAIVHLAGPGNVDQSWREPAEYLHVVAGGTLNVLEGARETGATVLLASTQRLYRPSSRPKRESDPLRPSDPYAQAKLTAEGLCKLYSERYALSTRVVRLFSVYGANQRGQGSSGVVAIFIQRALAGADLIVDACPRRDFTHVDDAARGICLALESSRPPRNRVYNIATGRGTSLTDLARSIVELSGSNSKLQLAEPAWSGGDLIADLTRARRDLGYAPRVELREGLRQVLTHHTSESSLRSSVNE